MSVQRTFPIVPFLCLATAACAVGVPDGGADPNPGFTREVRGGRVHLAAPSTGRRPDDIDVASIAATPALAPALGDLGAGDLVEVGRVVTTDSAAAALVHVQLAQHVDGVPIHGAYLHVTLRPGDDPSGTRLLASSYHLYQGPAVDTGVELGSEGAEQRARDALRAAPDAATRSIALELWPLDGELALVWDVTVAGRDARALVRANGDRAGLVEVKDERVDASAGVVEGWEAVGGAPGGAGTPRRVPLRDLAVRAGGATAYTGDTGHFALAGGGTVRASLTGRAAIVVDRGGADAGASAPAGSGLDLVLGDRGEDALAQVTAYETVSEERAWLVANGFPTGELGRALEVAANVDDVCNAYFSPPDRTLNLFRSGGGCHNSAERSIIAHEYGHFVDDAYGGIADGGLSEGWGDVLSCLFRDDPTIGPDLLPGRAIRSCANTYVYPSDGQDEVHALGQAWSGFVWDLRAGLQRALGRDAGDALARKLVLPSLRDNAADIPSAVREVFVRDDDDGDLSNGTPHWSVLSAAAKRHGLELALGGDTIPPARVTDLRATAVHAASVTVTWTAPGDDGDTGRAARYELRWSRRRLTDATFAAATPIAAPRPAAAGHAQRVSFAIPPGTDKLYVAVRALDELGNAAPLSNVLLVHPTAPKIAFAADEPAAWTTSGLWHSTTRHQPRGAHAFWYGDDARGNYDTGAANGGDLVSPVIDLAGVDHPVLAWDERLHVEGDARFDLATVTVTAIDDPAFTVTASRGEVDDTGAEAVARGLDLAPVAGRRVRVTFRFDSVDAAENQLEGWMVANLRVIADDVAARPGSALLIDEVLADPPAGYDANGDGVASPRDDEFVELVAAGAAPLTLAGYTLEDATRVRFTFPEATVIPPGKALVVFGGGRPALSAAPTLVVPDGLGLDNAGDVLRIRDPDGEIVAELGWGAEGGHGQSLVRSPDGDPAAPMVGHRSVSAAPASPGTRSDGSGW